MTARITLALVPICPVTVINFDNHSGSVAITFTGQVHALEFDNILNNVRLGILPFHDLGFGEPLHTRTPDPSTFHLVGAVLIAVSRARRRRKS